MQWNMKNLGLLEFQKSFGFLWFTVFTCVSCFLTRLGKWRGGGMRLKKASSMEKWAVKDGGGVRTVPFNSDFWKGGKERHASAPRSRGRTPKTLYPKIRWQHSCILSSVLEGRLQAKQHFFNLTDCATAWTQLPVESGLQNQWVSKFSKRLLDWLWFDLNRIYFFTKKEFHNIYCLCCCVELQCASTVCFRFPKYPEMFGITIFPWQLHVCTIRCLGLETWNLLF